MNTEEFIEKARAVHGDKYDYSKSIYVSHKTKICIICPQHGEFLQSPYDHLSGKGCRKCSGNEKITYEVFLKKFKEKHGNAFDFSKTEYFDYKKTKICVICSKHGEFWQYPHKLVANKFPCRKCAIEHRGSERSSKDTFIDDAKKVHGNKYDYSKVEYINNRTKVCIICPIHGEFWQTPQDHLRSYGCNLCSNIQRAKSKTKTQDSIIARFKDKHGELYDYSKVNYKGIYEKVCIICPKHGEFWQTPDNHIHGKGCPICKSSKLENEIKVLLEEKSIEYVYEKKFNWLGRQSIDFFIPSFNVGIECQGIQHFESIEIFGGEKQLKHVVELDENKKKLCEEHGIKIFYYSNLGIKYPYKVYEDFDEMLGEILNENNELINVVTDNDLEKEGRVTS